MKSTFHHEPLRTAATLVVMSLLRNNAGRQNRWLGLRLIGRKCNIDAIGTRIVYKTGEMKRHVDKVGGG